MEHDAERKAEWAILWAQSQAGTRVRRWSWGREMPGTLLVQAIRSSNRAEVQRMRQVLQDGVPDVPSDVVLRSDDVIPERIRQLKDTVWGFWYRGDLGLLEREKVGVIGARQPRGESIESARLIAGQVAREGIPIVSGLAIGVDSAAHRGAVEVGGPTIAVLGSGLGHVHPARNRELVERIVDCGGLVISEYAPRTPPFKSQFRERNRLIAALSDLLVVVQARHASGSMQTVDFAMGLGVEVAALPAGVGDQAFEASIALLRDGAHAVVDGSSVLRLLGREPTPSAEAHVFGRLLDQPRTPDDLVLLSGMALEDVLVELLDLENLGLVGMSPDGRYVNALTQGEDGQPGRRSVRTRL